MDVKIDFSFLKFFNILKGVHKAQAEDDIDPDWFEKRADKKTKEKYQKFNKWKVAAGITHPKVKYPVMFGKGDNMYPGMMATEDIPPGEVMIKVPSNVIISTKAAYECEPLKELFYDNPDVFGNHVNYSDDNLLNTFILYQLSLGEKSTYFHVFETWPRDTDILMNWEDEDLEWLQDPTLAEDAIRGQDDYMASWERLHRCLRNYKHLFPASSISLLRFKWVYILTTNRCFSSNWPAVCQMVPFADNVNHENVDSDFDCVDKEGKSLGLTPEAKEDQDRADNCEKHEFIESVRSDLLKIEQDLRRKIEEAGGEGMNEEDRQEQALNLKLQQARAEQATITRNRERMRKENKDEKKPEEADDYSSGLDSDNDIDILVEQEASRKKKAKQLQERARLEKPEEKGEVRPKVEKLVLSKDESKAVWEKTFSNVDKEYDFVIRTGKQGYPKGSQVYICYGRMSSREMLKRYGFCLQHNKYNNIYIKMKLALADPHFKYREYILQKFFETESKQSESGDATVQSRHFKIYYQKLNTKVLKFVKILNFDVQRDDIDAIIETRSLSLEYMSLQKLKTVYEEFLEGFPTTLKEDLQMTRDPALRSKLTTRQYFAVIFRSEQKRILINQIKLVRVALHIIERLMKGLTLEFAVTRVFELESRQDHPINRLMMQSYLKSLEKGLKKNQHQLYENIAMDVSMACKDISKDKDPQAISEVMKQAVASKQMSQPAATMAEVGQQFSRLTQKNIREQGLTQSASLHRQFELLGYEKMVNRMMENPLSDSQKDGKEEMHAKILKLKEALKAQQSRTRDAEVDVQRGLIRDLLKAQEESGDTKYQDLKLKDIRDSKVKKEPEQEADGASSYYDSEYESEEDADQVVKSEQEEKVQEEKKEESSDEDDKLNDNYLENMKYEWRMVQKVLAEETEKKVKEAEMDKENVSHQVLNQEIKEEPTFDDKTAQEVISAAQAVQNTAVMEKVEIQEKGEAYTD